jgi:hypothetical protein
MRPRTLWTLVLLGLPRLAAPDGATSPAVEPIPPGSQPALETAEEPAAISRPALDLRIDPTQLPASHDPPRRPRPIGPERMDNYPGADQHATESGLSFDVEIRPRSQFGSEARHEAAPTPGLQDDVERMMERSTVGVRGRYRF